MRLTLLTLLLCCALACPALSQTFKVNPETGETEAQFASRTAWWRDARFGLFIHWGIYSVPADSSQGAAEWYFYNHTDTDPVTGKPVHFQVAQYEKFAGQFDPVDFDARKWVSIAKQAGMKYIVITSKHHDGFCMFNTKLTNYNVVKATPWAHDPMKDLARECKRQGIRLCFYYSFMDWHHPDYLPRRPWDTRPTDGASLDKYVDYVKGQLRELLTQYGTIGIIWFDGGWEHNAQEEHSLEIVKLIRSLQPGIIINNRLNLPEDYDTPEQSIPASALPGGRLWETCMTMNNTWGYSRNDHDWKSAPDLIHKLCDIASKGGNFLLNVGPDDLGRIPQASVDRLRQVGSWMAANGASIYGTEKSPFRRLSFDGRCTTKGNHLYLQVFTWPADGLELQGLKSRVLSARTLATGQELSTSRGGSDGETVSISRPSQLDPVATVIDLRLAGPPAVVDQSPVARPDAAGKLNLMAADADIHGSSAQLENTDSKANIGYWTNAADTVEWVVDVPSAGRYRVVANYACEPTSAGSTYRVEVQGTSAAADSVQGQVSSTGAWSQYVSDVLPGELNLSAGRQSIRIVPLSMPRGAVMNLRFLQLIPSAD